jgi:pyridoxal/pyridoxine/pyridoxamine kinase
MKDLSNEAKAVLLGCFLSASTSIKFHMIKSIPSPQFLRGVGDLISAGLVVKSYEGTVEVYKLTDAGMNLNRRTLVKGSPLEFMAEHGGFPISVPKDCTPTM